MEQQGKSTNWGWKYFPSFFVISGFFKWFNRQEIIPGLFVFHQRFQCFCCGKVYFLTFFSRPFSLWRFFNSFVRIGNFRIVFCGTNGFLSSVLSSLLDDFWLKLEVVCCSFESLKTWMLNGGELIDNASHLFILRLSTTLFKGWVFQTEFKLQFPVILLLYSCNFHWNPLCSIFAFKRVNIFNSS